MSIDPSALESLNRDELIAKARQLGAQRAELLTRPELRDEIIRLSASTEDERRRARGWFGVARDLVASVVSQGLNLPDTADLIRGVNVFAPKAAAPVATVTLAEIYAAQGHLKKALDLLDEVLAKEPDHEAARRARERWAQSPAPDAGVEVCDTPHSDHQPAVEAVMDGEAVQNDVAFSDHLAEPGLAPAVTDAVTRVPSEPEAATLAPRPPVENRLVVFRSADASLLCDWELSEKSVDRLRLAEPSGTLTLRALESVASWDGPVTEERDYELKETLGHCRVVPLGEKNPVRVVLGWKTEQRFVVLALGAEFGWSETGPSLRWVPPHSLSPEAWQRLGGAAAARLNLENLPT